MAKLNKKQQETVANAESSFDAIPAGIYASKILSVDTTKKGPAGPYWKFEFAITKGKHKGRKQWVNASLSEDAAWRMQEIFDACGFDYDTDSEDFVGEEVKIVVSESIIQSGAKKGQAGNNVDKVMAIDADDDEAGGDGSGDDDDDFSDANDENNDDDDAPDLDALAEVADDDDSDEDDAENAVTKLTEIAEGLDLNPDDFDTWADLVTAINEKNAEDEKPAKKKGGARRKSAPKKPGKKGGKKKSDDSDDFDF